MARGRGKRRDRNAGGRNNDKKGRDDDKKHEFLYRTDLLDKSSMTNERLFSYYKDQAIIPEEEWDVFVEALRDHLPTTFRLSGSRQGKLALNEIIKNKHVPTLMDVEFEDQKIPPPVQIPWYPGGLAWQFNVPKKVLRKQPEFRSFHSFLVGETDVGNISRQEAVSMLPPLCLDVKPGHRVIDMCAAPGSKTAQLLEALHAAESEAPEGLLVANDSDYKRTHLLIHQSARLPSPALVVTNLDASNYPAIKLDGKKLMFDRILCDVPCSGDGTIRKNVAIWKTWQPSDGNGLHALQVRILQRAMQMLAPGGRIVYSTCSLNPVENEAVIATALNTNPDFHLLPSDEFLPGLVRRPGLTAWKPTYALPFPYVYYDSYEAFAAANASLASKLSPSHWPPANASELNLSRCMRLYPHHQDTGGFFVAILERNTEAAEAGSSKKKRVASPFPETDTDTKKPRLEESTPTTEDISESTIPTPVELSASIETQTPVDDAESKPTPVQSADPESRNNGSFKENPYTFLAADDPTVVKCIENLSLTDKFPKDCVLVRNPDGSAVRSMYLTTPLVRQLIHENDYARLRLNSAGTKVFAKQEGAHNKGDLAQFRILAEGLDALMPYIPAETMLSGDLSVLKTLVTAYYPLCSSFVEPFKAEITARDSGSHVVKFTVGTDTIYLPIWKSNVSVSLQVDKKAKSALSLRVFGEDITTAGRENAARKEKKQQIANAGATTAQNEAAASIDTPDEALALEAVDAETKDV
ncbi:cytosine-5--methyltransferase [Cylindrobasidium torrendii FP15055 ss-10]|uniref:Cytosine-5--methyltransferase n=1 Tax=Cylindrobasidium torrendii FP15055 ss-10 TaxID=1314674 RepID=A0A0D7AU22_9AGAR|nr:cytosine-5--methyltransferase [Cylindrobasidium torrendii FP15055 ss-10]